MEKITIIIPAYNAERDISRCLDSVCAQTYPNVEVLVINDGSRDQTENICRSYLSRLKNMRLLQGEHRGVSAARNQGIRAATGKYLFFLDADDQLSPSGLETLIRYCGQGQWTIGNYQKVNVKKTSRPEFHPQYFQGEVHRGDREELPQLCVSRNFNCVWGKLYSAQIIHTKGILFDEGRDYGEDLVFNLEYFQYVQRFVILREPVYLYCYRFGEGLGTRFIRNEWAIQKELCGKIQRMSQDVYHLSADGCGRMNQFYYAQAIAALQRIADEKTLRPQEKRAEMRKITGSEFFREILEKEYHLKRIGNLDRLLLRGNMGGLYHRIHRGYATLKEYIHKGKKNGK